ncbi:MAG TPA: RHS repeat-associated core domain-containing protein [Ktedonobacteraceae bacterium]|nr:RHS repeat-associated core domain-containing protein [Ktedonobacteraceae bacterium]
MAGSSTTTTTYYYAGTLRIAEAVNGTFSYLGSDVLGSTAVALNAAGQLTAAQLYGPYGTVRYSSGTMPTDIGFTGQRGDSATGLDYYNARYYDPVVGQFISADTVLPGGGFDPWGLSRYAYVQGNPETMTDPTGHWGWALAAAIVLGAALVVALTVASPAIVSVAVGVAVGGIVSVGIDLAVNGLPKNDADLDQMGVDALLGEAAGGIGGYYGAPAAVDVPDMLPSDLTSISARQAATRAQDAARDLAIKNGVLGGTIGGTVQSVGHKVLDPLVKGRKQAEQVAFRDSERKKQVERRQDTAATLVAEGTWNTARGQAAYNSRVWTTFWESVGNTENFFNGDPSLGNTPVQYSPVQSPWRTRVS